MRRWVSAYARAQLKKRIARELAEVDRAGRFSLLPPRRAEAHGRQTFRAFVQVVVLPRAR